MMPLVRLLGIVGSAFAWGTLTSRAPTEEAGGGARTYTVLDARPIASVRPMTRRDLIGKTVREVRHAGEDHWDAVEVAYKSERFTVRFDVTPQRLTFGERPLVEGLKGPRCRLEQEARR